MKLHHSIFLVACSILVLCSCSVSKQISKQASNILINDTVISKGHIGISIFEPATQKYWYNHDAGKYFIPASNTKLFTLYAGMKYLGDSLAGLRYSIIHDTVFCLPTGDPTFMHPGFKTQYVNDFFQAATLPLLFNNQNWKATKYGNGWAWDDYNDSYMAERNAFPIFGNLVKTGFTKYLLIGQHSRADSFLYYNLQMEPTLPDVSVSYKVDSTLEEVIIKRKESENAFEISFPDKEFSIKKDIPFVTNNITTALEILHTRFHLIQSKPVQFNTQHSSFKIIKTQPSDSLFKPMMFYSDNFFAEQTLLMASNEHLGYMSDEDMIDTLLNTDLKDVPQKPRWVDGSGLSRYNLFTPMSFVYILNKMKTEFGLERLKVILPTGGQGSLKNYFTEDAGFVYAKTGTISNNSSLSGFLITKKGKLLIFSLMANGYQSGVAPVRSAMEHFLKEIRENY